ncbi:tetratricopeptide repeat protein [Rhizobium alvei]|uniref:Tetratricopeptide repeat protein n=1 Tax=Rhizobium alvei TaxID=1132659 RepID=A0ABT8YTF4_9HYPH|nr:hypothetical protein [Rhizobium alvei]MDO6967048.1 hypothetical protein [Rhizobium alvei]
MTVAVQSLQNRQEFKLDPDQELQRGLQARRSGDRALAKDIFAGVVAQFPGHTWARYELVQELRFEGSVGEATTVAEDALKYPGVSPQLLGTLADLLGEACEFEKQRLFLEMAAEKFATRAYPWIHMSKSLAARDEMEGAFDALHRGFTSCIDREQKDLVAEQHGRLASTVHMHCLKFDAWPPKAGAEIKNACVVQLIKDEEDILGDQLEYPF